MIPKDTETAEPVETKGLSPERKAEIYAAKRLRDSTPEAKAAKNAAQREKWRTDKSTREASYWRLAMVRYGMTEADAEQMKAEQENRCFLCARDFTGRPHIDHFHDPDLGVEGPRGWQWHEDTTPEQKRRTVRWLCCAKCNALLGHLWDEPLVMRDVADRLDEWERTYRTPEGSTL